MDKKSFNKFFNYSSGLSKENSSQHPSVLQLKTPVYNSVSRNTETGITSSQVLNVSSLINSPISENSNLYENLQNSSSFYNQSRLGSLNILTDKQNVVNPLKSLDGSKKISYKNNGSFSYLDELLVDNQNNFFS
jgi:hypothetical protein